MVDGPEDIPEHDGDREDDPDITFELTDAQKKILLQQTEGIRKLIANTYAPVFGLFKKQMTEVIKIPAIPANVLDSFHRIAAPSLAAQRFLDSTAFKFGAGEALKGFDFGGVNTAAQIVARANFGWSEQLQGIVNQIAQQQSAWLKTLGKLDFKSIIYPPNLAGIEGLKLSELEQVVLVEGIALYGVPRQAIAEAIIRAQSPQKRREILGRRWRDISVDCRERVEACESHQLQPLQPFVVRMLDAMEAGHPEAAQALAASLLDTILTMHLAEDRAILVPSRKVKTPEGYDELTLREWLALAPIWSAHQNYRPNEGDPIPRTFNRHAARREHAPVLQEERDPGPHARVQPFPVHRPSLQPRSVARGLDAGRPRRWTGSPDAERCVLPNHCAAVSAVSDSIDPGTSSNRQDGPMAKQGATSAKRHAGSLELTWTDKDKALLSTGDGKYDYTFVDPADYRVSEIRLLDEVERIEAPTWAERPDDLPQPTTDNLLITGDAMHVLDALAKIPEYAEKYLGKVKLVYIDPPFNTGQAFANYEDNIEHSIWLTMLRDRLRQIRPLLAEDGSVWVHLDDVEVHRCRAVMDDELGAENFVAEVVWQKADGLRSDAKGLSISHDTILTYAATSRWIPNRTPRTAAQNARFSSPDRDPNPWFDDNPTAPNANTHQGMVYAIQHPITGELIYPTRGRCWWTEQQQVLTHMSRYAEYKLMDIGDEAKRAEVCGVPVGEVRRSVLALMLAQPLEVSAKSAQHVYETCVWPGIVLRSGGRGGLGRKSYIPSSGFVPDTWWPNGMYGHNREAKAEIKALFPGQHPFATPKPERLLHRVIQIATNPGDIVFDCFAGSGTTAAVAHKMGRRWVTSELLRKTTDTFTKPRLAKVVRGEDPGGITRFTERVVTDEVALPDGMTPSQAQEFNRLLKKSLKALNAPDPVTVKALRAATKTKVIATTLWHGGGGFSHLQVGPSMFTAVGDMILLAEWATQGDLSRAMCAQLGVGYRPEGIFAAKQGRARFVVVDGMVGKSTIDSILDQLVEGEIVEVWATQIEPGAADALRGARPGSLLSAIPAAVLDNYRHKSAKETPFGGKVKENADG